MPRVEHFVSLLFCCCCFDCPCRGIFAQKAHTIGYSRQPCNRIYLRSLPLLSSKTVKERYGPRPSTAEAIENVRKCAAKECLSPDLRVEKQYSVDRISEGTGLKRYHKLLGTAKNESLYWWVRFGYKLCDIGSS